MNAEHKAEFKAMFPRERLNLRNVGSVRYWLLVGVPAYIVGWLAALLWEPLLWPVAVVVFVLLGFAALFMEDDFFCPECKKRLRSGAKKCSHCASPVGKARVR